MSYIRLPHLVFLFVAILVVWEFFRSRRES